MAQVRWTVGAKFDLREVVNFIAADSPTYAEITANRILTAIERLERHPRLGRVVPEYRLPDLRELIVGAHRVVYRIQRNDAGIVAIVHGSQNLLRRLGDRPWIIE